MSTYEPPRTNLIPAFGIIRNVSNKTFDRVALTPTKMAYFHPNFNHKKSLLSFMHPQSPQPQQQQVQNLVVCSRPHRCMSRRLHWAAPMPSISKIITTETQYSKSSIIPKNRITDTHTSERVGPWERYSAEILGENVGRFFLGFGDGEDTVQIRDASRGVLEIGDFFAGIAESGGQPFLNFRNP